jgi:hypothetical protein
MDPERLFTEAEIDASYKKAPDGLKNRLPLFGLDKIVFSRDNLLDSPHVDGQESAN